MSPSKLRFLAVSDSNFFHWTGPYGERHFTETETKITFVSVLARHQNFDPYGNTKIPTRITKTMSLHLQQYYYATVKSHVTCQSMMQPTMMNQVILISRSGPASITHIFVSWWKAWREERCLCCSCQWGPFKLFLVWCDVWWEKSWGNWCSNSAIRASKN